MKLAPLVSAFKKYPEVKLTIVHTGQHYDRRLSGIFFDELNIPKPDIDLGIGSYPHAVQTGKIIIAFDAFLEHSPQDLVIVVGDVNSTMACALTAVKRSIPVAHVEAGLRSFDWEMPEEINRIVTDRVSDFLFCTEQSAIRNLHNEGIANSKIFLVGNTMIDTLMRHKKTAEKSNILKRLQLEAKKYGVLTIHRPQNVDEYKKLDSLMRILCGIGEKIQIVFPVHPRTRSLMKRWRIKTHPLITTEPLGYLDFLKLMSHASFAFTDSGGIQEETTILGIPCLTLRENTERPITLSQGTNHLVGTNEKKILATLAQILRGRLKKAKTPKYWDGKAAERIVKILTKALSRVSK